MNSMRKVCALLLAGLTFALPGIVLADSAADEWLHSDALTGDLGGLRSSARESGLTLNGSYTGEVAANLSGGDRRTALYAQQVELEALLDMQRLAGIDAARIQVTLNYRDGRSLTQEDLHNQFPVQELYSYSQVVRLSQFNWLQHLADDHVIVQIGWSPVGNDFARLPGFCKFQNLVICGHAYAMTVNSGSLNGPISQWGARIKVWPTDNFYINTGAYRNNINGDSTGGFDLSFDHDGNFYPLEFGWEHREGPRFGSFALGAYYNTVDTRDVYYDVNRNSAGLTGLPFLTRGGRYGGYVMGERVVHQPEPGNAAHTLSIFAIAGVGDKATARFRRFANAGALYQGPVTHRPNDFVSFLVAWAATNPGLSQYQRDRNQMLPGSVSAQRWEAVVELDYGIQATPWLLLQPNLQYITQARDNEDRSGALVLGLHFTVKL